MIGDGPESAGSLFAQNGLYVDFGSGLTGTGEVTVGATAAAAFINNGAVAGDAAGSLALNGYVKGVGDVRQRGRSTAPSPRASRPRC